MNSALAIIWFSGSKLHTRLESVVISSLIVSCSCNADKRHGSNDCFLGPFVLTIKEIALLKNFHSQPRHGHAVFTFHVYQPTSPCSTLMLTQNQSPKDIAESDMLKQLHKIS